MSLFLAIKPVGAAAVKCGLQEFYSPILHVRHDNSVAIQVHNQHSLIGVAGTGIAHIVEHAPRLDHRENLLKAESAFRYQLLVLLRIPGEAMHVLLSSIYNVYTNFQGNNGKGWLPAISAHDSAKGRS